ncbi:MAG: hypothetical protein K6F69_03595 [Treponema sp.]|nr:hypothetical protein [Treponema sp.]
MSTVKVITSVCILALLTVFCGFNINNRCDVNLIFTTVTDVPVFVSLMVAFLAGVIIMVPVMLFNKLSSKKNNKIVPDENALSDTVCEEAKNTDASSENIVSEDNN